jgi:lysophospholipase L1-like esterase
MRLGGLVVLCLISAAAHASPKAEVVPSATFEEPKALAAFQAALAAQQAGNAAHALRISYFGDSLTADDQITHALREKLDALLGDGGPGFVWAVPPHPYCQHRAIARASSGTWRVHGISTVQPTDHLLGLGGSAETDSGGSIRLVAKANVTSIDLHYLAQPKGGAIAVFADGKEVGTVQTSAEKKQAAFAQLAMPDGARKFELRASGKVRLFGAALENAKGAVVDNLGVVNATAKQLANHNLPEHWQKQLSHRGADLVVIMLGTNEAEWLAPRGQGMAEHEKLFGDLLESVRTGNPNASCLVVSPLDQTDYTLETMPSRESIPAMVAAQHRAATAHGCAFWDTYAWMGGKGASKVWYRRGLVVKDYQHPTTNGAVRIANALYAGLTAR